MAIIDEARLKKIRAEFGDRVSVDIGGLDVICTVINVGVDPSYAPPQDNVAGKIPVGVETDMLYLKSQGGASGKWFPSSECTPHRVSGSNGAPTA